MTRDAEHDVYDWCGEVDTLAEESTTYDVRISQETRRNTEYVESETDSHS